MVALLRWIAGSLATVFAVILIVSNIIGPWRAREGRGYSSFPFLGGLLGVGALWLLPVARLHAWCWIPLVIDLYSAPMLVLLVVGRIRRNDTR